MAMLGVCMAYFSAVGSGKQRERRGKLQKLIPDGYRMRSKDTPEGD